MSGVDRTKLPPVKAKQSKALAGLQRVMADEKKLAEARKISEGLVFYDHQSPAVRKRRANARQLFEGYVQILVDNEEATVEEMYNKDLFIDRCCDMLSCAAMEMTGAIGDKPRVDGLYQIKDGIAWWAVRLVPAFSTIYSAWHAQTTAAIHKIGLSMGFETSHWEKNNLHETEIALFYRQIGTVFKTGLENWKQHYAAWLMVYITAVRPGSFTVCQGYAAGDELPDGTFRKESETLRWSDVDFIRLPTGIAVQINFRYNKGQRNPYSRAMMVGQRLFTITPLSTDRYEFDLAAVLLGIAHSRGLFGSRSLESIATGDERNIAKDETINKEAVFLEVDRGGKLVKKPMNEKALGPKLQEMCVSVGLLSRNTIYSLRRAALVDTKRKEGVDQARELANHVPGGKSIYAYDHSHMEDLDSVAHRFSTKDGYTRSQLRRLFGQVATARVQLRDSTQQSLQEVLNHRAALRLGDDEEYVAKELELRALIDEAALALNQPSLLLSNVNLYQVELAASDIPEHKTLLRKLNECLASRKNLKRVLKRKHLEDVKEKMLEEHRQQVKVAQSKAQSTGRHGAPTQVERGQLAEASTLVENLSARATADIEALDTTVEESEELETEAEREVLQSACEDVLDHTRQEPTAWAELPDSVTLEIDVGEGDPATHIGRLNFIKSFRALETLQSAGLQCVMCQLDVTVEEARKTKTFRANELDKHLKSDYHSREAQLVRAFVHDAGQGKRKSKPCPICGEKLTRSTILEHIEEAHEEFWI